MASAEGVYGADPPPDQKQAMTWTIPNILTVMRLLAAPGVAIAFAIFDRPYAATMTVVVLLVLCLLALVQFRVLDRRIHYR